MINKKSALLTASLLAGLGAAFFRIFIFNRYYLPEENRFGAGAVHPNNIVLVALLLLALAFYVVSMRIKENGPIEFPTSKGIKYSMLVMTALLALSYPLALLFGKDVFATSNSSMLAIPFLGEIAAFLPLIALVPTVIFFAANFTGNYRNSATFKALSIAPAVWAALYVMHSYFDLNYTFRDANRLICEIAYIAVAFRFLMEARYYIKYPAPRMFLTTSCISVMLGTAYALPSLIMTIVGVIPFNVNFCFEIALPAIIVYFYIGTLKWAREENVKVLPNGEKRPEDEQNDTEEKGEAKDAVSEAGETTASTDTENLAETDGTVSENEVTEKIDS